MDDAAGVRGSEAAGDLQCVGRRLAHRQRSVLEARAERLAVHEFHHDEGAARVLDELVNRQDVGVRQLRDADRLALEARERCRVVRERLGDHLDRNVTPEPRIAGTIDGAHAAGAERRDDFVATETRSGSQRHRRKCSASRQPPWSVDPDTFHDGWSARARCGRLPHTCPLRH